MCGDGDVWWWSVVVADVGCGGGNVWCDMCDPFPADVGVATPLSFMINLPSMNS